jgi:hypothetical protein
MTEKVNIGDNIDLGKVGYVSLPDGAVVTSGRIYTVRHEGRHIAHGNESVEYEVVDPNKPEEGDDESDDYNDWTGAALREELKERELSQSGNKAELVARLVADDNEE